MLTSLEKTPFPYFGGKSDASEHVWAALGDVVHYAEPFAGSLAVLLRRPHRSNRTSHSETVNDVDGLLVNAWRSIQLSPDATAEAASNPVAEADLHARHLALCRWREENELGRLMCDPLWHDPVMGGWWIWGLSCWIGGGWCGGTGPWVEGEDGRLARRNGKTGPGVVRQLPHLTGCQGVNHPAGREPGTERKRPHLSDGGQGVNRPAGREPGTERDADDGDNPYHPVTMPEVRRWMLFLSARLRHVRILNGDWSRLCTKGALKTSTVRMNGGKAGVFLDPPYGAAAARDSNLYTHDSATVADNVRTWCATNGDDPDYRIVLAGFQGEHDALQILGWREVEWFKPGFLKGGMAHLKKNGGHQQHRERLWLSPHCLDQDRRGRQSSMEFDALAQGESAMPA